MSNDTVKTYRAAVITASDKGSEGQREDVSGSVLKEILEANGYKIVSYCVLPDDKDQLAGEMRRLADNDLCDIILTTGGTGFSPRYYAGGHIIRRRPPGTRYQRSNALLQYDDHQTGYA